MSLGACPIPARAAIVLEDPYVEEFPTERTEIKMTALKTEGSTFMPPNSMAMTNGDAAAPVPFSRLGLVYGTMKPINRRLVT
jgi:hypothetical protein